MSRRTRLDIVPPDYTQRHAGRVVTNVFDYVADRTLYLNETRPNITSLRDIQRFTEKALKHLVIGVNDGIEKNLLWQCRFLGGIDRRLFTYQLDVRRDGRGGATITLAALQGRVTHHAGTRLLQHHKSKTMKDLLEHLRYASAFANEASLSKAKGAVTDARGDQYCFKYDREEGSILATFIAESSVHLAVPHPEPKASIEGRTGREEAIEKTGRSRRPEAVEPLDAPTTGHIDVTASTPRLEQRPRAVTCARRKREIPITYRRKRVYRSDSSDASVQPVCLGGQPSPSFEVYC
jgi:hypothetical protein